MAELQPVWQTAGMVSAGLGGGLEKVGEREVRLDIADLVAVFLCLVFTTQLDGRTVINYGD